VYKRQIEDDGAWGVDICADNGFVISGVTNSFANGFSAAYIIRTDAVGDTIWTSTFEKKNGNCAFDVKTTSDGGFLLAGIAETGGAPGADGLVIKINSIGDTLWSKLYGGASYDDFSSFCEDIYGNYLLCGTTYNLTAGSYDVYLVKITNNGDLIWEKSLGGANADNAYPITQTNDNNFIVSGSTESFGAGGKDVYLIKFNSNGDTIWTKTFGGSGDDWASSIKETADGGFIVTGYTKSFSNYYDVYLIKTDVNGISGVDSYNKNNTDFNLYPNPNNGSMQLQYTLTNNQPALFEMVDFTGRLVYSMPLIPSAGSADITATCLSRGVYMYRVVSGGVAAACGKVVVIK
jgi:hypothetical protein